MLIFLVILFLIIQVSFYFEMSFKINTMIFSGGICLAIWVLRKYLDKIFRQPNLMRFRVFCFTNLLLVLAVSLFCMYVIGGDVYLVEHKYLFTKPTFLILVWAAFIAAGTSFLLSLWMLRYLKCTKKINYYVSAYYCHSKYTFIYLLLIGIAILIFR